jgi:4-amino-4-deoxy-L-arabinose transferase-like glycosyltransferase
VLFLNADALPDLCWGTGIWTDEGFYNHNARNFVLFGQAERDQFNNYNLSPVLDLIQRFIFTNFGVSLISTRLISVFFGLTSLIFFYDGLRRKLPRRVALTATVFLGLDPLYLFYNRLGLMESPAVCLVCAAFWAWCIGGARFLVLSGSLAASLIAWKTSFLLFAPLPMIASVWQTRKLSVRALWPYLLGITLALTVYYFLWFRPHQGPIVHMNRHYAMEQARPKSANQALWMVRRAWFGYQNGFMNRLFTRSPIIGLLVLIGFFVFPQKKITKIFYLWTVLGILWISVSKYAPTRYFLVFWPGLCALAACTLWRLPVFLKRRSGRIGLGLGLLLLGIHWTQPLLFALGQKDLALGIGFVVGGALVLGLVRWHPPCLRVLLPIALGLFLLGALGQTGHYFLTRGYRTQEIARELVRLAGPDATIIGDWAPGFCLPTTLKTAPVFAKLANDDHPVERLQADFILTSRDRVHSEQWRKFAPKAYLPENRVAVFPLYQYTLELYQVPKESRP